MATATGKRMRRGAPVKVWCGRRDSNPHDFHHRNLNPARLPVPPRPPRARHSPRGLQRIQLYSNRGGSLHEKTAWQRSRSQKCLQAAWIPPSVRRPETPAAALPRVDAIPSSEPALSIQITGNAWQSTSSSPFPDKAIYRQWSRTTQDKAVRQARYRRSVS